MCGRYTIVSKADTISQIFGIEVKKTVEPQYNAAPSYNLPVITDAAPHQLSFFRWGLIPSWAKDMKWGHKTINARSETILTKASFKKPIRSQRCLVLANCYFEWQKNNDGSKSPFLIYCMNQRLFAMAGVWDIWHDKENGEKVQSFSIITVPAVKRLENIHERMPAILPRSKAGLYLNKTASIETVSQLLQPYSNEQMNAMPVSHLVNSPTNNSKEILEPTGNKLF